MRRTLRPRKTPARSEDLYGRGDNVIHKTCPKNVGGGWVYRTTCGVEIPQKNPYRHSSVMWKFVTCSECLALKKERKSPAVHFYKGPGNLVTRCGRRIQSNGVGVWHVWKHVTCKKCLEWREKNEAKHGRVAGREYAKC